MNWKSLRTLFFLWMAWVVIVSGYQSLIVDRLDLVRPDYATLWTPGATRTSSAPTQTYLRDPFMNEHVSWDSEFYLSIANSGYDDPIGRSIDVQGSLQLLEPSIMRFGRETIGDSLNLNYAFMPFYPLMMKGLAAPLSVFDMSEIATLTLAGYIISIVGTLVGMVALYDIARDKWGEESAIRTAFYLLIFPTSMFFAQIYTEGLFIGLSFASLALIRRERWLLATLLAICATWTRAIGVGLFIPMLWPWIQNGDWLDLDMGWREIYFNKFPWRSVGKAIIHLSPIFAFLLWKLSPLGFGFSIVEDQFFGRGLLAFGQSFNSWFDAAESLFEDNTQRKVYNLFEFGGIFIGLMACWRMWKLYPILSLYSFTVIFLALTSGPAQGMHRYVLAAPVVFLWLGRLGRHPAFDRAWSIASILLMGMLLTLFSFDFWVA